MSVDKFGRHGGVLQHRKLKGPPGEGFNLTAEGHYDMENKMVRNMGEPKTDKDAVTLCYLEKHCIMKVDNNCIECENKTLRNIGKPELENDAVSLQYLKNKTLVRNSEGHYDVKGKLIRNLAPPIEDNDVATRGYITNVLRILKKNIEDKFVRLESVVFKHVHNNRETYSNENDNS